jgi:hypothetical protein
MEELNLKAEESLKKTEPDSGHVSDSGHGSESDEVLEYAKNEKTGEIEPYTREIVWGNVVKFIILHALALYSVTYLPVMSLRCGSLPSLPYSFLELASLWELTGSGLTRPTKLNSH